MSGIRITTTGMRRRDLRAAPHLLERRLRAQQQRRDEPAPRAEPPLTTAGPRFVACVHALVPVRKETP